MGGELQQYQGPLAEFVALRQEIERRNVAQHALFVLQLTVSGTVFSFALADAGHIGFLLIVPVSTYMLCARYVEQQYGTQRAAIYIKDELSGRVPGGLHWESWQLANPRFVRGSIIRRINALMITFPAVGAGALVWTAAAFDGRLRLDAAERSGYALVWLLGAVGTVMCVQMIWTMLRHPLGDSALPPLYRLPSPVGQGTTSPQTTEQPPGAQ